MKITAHPIELWKSCRFIQINRGRSISHKLEPGPVPRAFKFNDKDARKLKYSGISETSVIDSRSASVYGIEGCTDR
jgi:hypothetical protein